MALPFPPELLFNILSRLPVKIVVRLCSVCKSWRSMIMSADFIAAHHRHSLKPGRGLLLHIPYVLLCSAPTTCALLSETTFGKRGKIPFPLKPSTFMFKIFGSINGLVCISEVEPVVLNHPIYNNTLYIWNPSLRKLKQVGNTRMMERLTVHSPLTLVGFGYDSQSDVYKVVRIWYSEVLEHDCVFEADVVEVFTLGCDDWKSFKPKTTINSFPSGDSEVNVNGVIHWPSTHSMNGDYDCILTFDVRNETLGEIPMPENYLDGLKLDKQKRSIFIGEFKGCLSVGVQCSIMESKNREQLLMWMMRDYGVASSWTKHLNVVLPESVERTLGFTRCEEVLFQKGNGDVSCYDTKLSKFYRVCKSEGTTHLNSCEVITLSESLVWFDN